MNVEYILKEWEKDSKLDKANLDIEALKVPELHHKYSKMLMFNKETIRKVEERLDLLERDKSEYYLGTARGENKECYDLKLPKADLPKYLKSDKDILPLKTKLKELKDIDELLSDIISNINSRSFLIREVISWLRFTNGLN